MQCEDIEQPEHAILIEQHEADQHQAAGQHVGHIEDEALHQKLRETNSSKRTKQAEHQRRAEELGHAEDAHLGDRGLEEHEQEAADRELAEIGRDTDRVGQRAAPLVAMPHGEKMQAISEM